VGPGSPEVMRPPQTSPPHLFVLPVEKLALDRLPAHLKGGDWDAERLPPEGLASSIWRLERLTALRRFGTCLMCATWAPQETAKRWVQGETSGPTTSPSTSLACRMGSFHPTEATTEEAFFSQVRARKRGFFVSNCSQCTDAYNYPALLFLQVAAAAPCLRYYLLRWYEVFVRGSGGCACHLRILMGVLRTFSVNVKGLSYRSKLKYFRRYGNRAQTQT